MSLLNPIFRASAESLDFSRLSQKRIIKINTSFYNIWNIMQLVDQAFPPVTMPVVSECGQVTRILQLLWVLGIHLYCSWGTECECPDQFKEEKLARH